MARRIVNARCPFGGAADRKVKLATEELAAGLAGK
jgi:hypothetical protein